MQIKKQLEGDKESVLGELNDTNNKLQGELEELQAKLKSLERVIGPFKTEISNGKNVAPIG